MLTINILNNQVVKEEVKLLINDIKKELKELPSNEFTYYIAVLIASIRNDAHSERNIVLLKKTQPLIQKLKQLYNNSNDVEKNIIQVTEALNELIKASTMQTLSHKIKKILLNICGAILAIFTGILGGLAGLTIGLFTNYNIVGNIKGSGLGFIAGVAVGALVGYRGPTKFLQGDIDTKVEFTINNIARLRDELKDRKTHEEYQKETKQYIIDTFFAMVPEDQKEAKFAEFLNEVQSFQICTTSAGHISNSLKGYLGHHSLIRFKINGVKDIPIEYGDRKKTPNHVDQSEKLREVKGQVLFDMLVFDRMLQETHINTLKEALRIYDIGSDDCRTYIDKILIGTGQEPTKIGRFSKENDKFISNKCVAPLIGFFSKTNDKDLHMFMDNEYDEKFDIIHHKFSGKIIW